MELLQAGIELETENQAVLACLAYHGRLPAMLEADHLADGSGREFRRSFTGWTSGHWLYVVAHFRNYAAAQDNGYVMIVIDLSLYTREQAAQIVSAWCGSGRDESGPWAMEVISNAPVSAN